MRYARWAAIRNTYPELKSTTIKTWQDWFPDSIAPIKHDTPITSRLFIKDIGDGTALDLEVLFIAIDRPEDVNKLRSLELTGVWLNEASELDNSILEMCTQRVGRYPAARRGGHSWAGVIADTNPPDDDHWWYKLAEEATDPAVKAAYQFFDQPGAMFRVLAGGEWTGEYKPNPLAENIGNLTDGYAYYQKLMLNKGEEWIKVFVLGEYGTTLAGKVVYPEWNDKYHVAKSTITPILGIPLVLCWDYGLTPACVVQQLSPKGQLLTLREFTSTSMGIRQFASDVVRPAIFTDYPRFKYESVGDPAGNQRAQTDEKTCEQELLEAGFPTEGAPTNEFVARREAVAYWLTRTVGGEPGYLLDPSCTMLRRGFNGRFHYARINASGGSRFKDRPDKNEYSHPHDANQYGCLYHRAGLTPSRALPEKKRSARGWT